MTLSLAALGFLWFTFVPSGMDTIFGEDEFDPLSGFVLLALTAVSAIGVLKRSGRMTWAGLGLAAMALFLWVWILTSAQVGVAPGFVVLYAVAAAALVVSLLLSARGEAQTGPR